MTVKIDDIEPNAFPAVDDLDEWDAGRLVDVLFDVTIEDKKLGASRRNNATSSREAAPAFPGTCGGIDHHRFRAAMHTPLRREGVIRFQFPVRQQYRRVGRDRSR